MAPAPPSFNKLLQVSSDPVVADWMCHVECFEEQYEKMWRFVYSDRELAKQAKRELIKTMGSRHFAMLLQTGKLNTYYEDDEQVFKEYRMSYKKFGLIMYLLGFFMTDRFAHNTKLWCFRECGENPFNREPGVHFIDKRKKLSTRLHALCESVERLFNRDARLYKCLEKVSQVKHAVQHFGVPLEALAGIPSDTLEMLMMRARKVLKCGIAVPAFGYEGWTDCIYHRSKLNYVQHVLVLEMPKDCQFTILPQQNELFLAKRAEYRELLRTMSPAEAGRIMGDPQ